MSKFNFHKNRQIMHRLFFILMMIIPFATYAQKNDVIELPSELKVATADEYGIFKWAEAKKKCENKGEGWSLPTKEELVEIYQYRDTIKGFTDSWYWSLSTDKSSTFFTDSDINPDYGNAWNLIFSNGVLVSNSKTYTIKARCVRHQ